MEIKNIFIDSNIWLNLYNFSDKNLEEFNKIISFIDKKEIRIYLPTQVKNEVIKNRENVIYDAYKKIENLNFNTNFPNLYKSYKNEYESIKDKISILQKEHDNLLKKINDDILNIKLETDKIIKRIMEKSIDLLDDEEIINKAKLRFNRGYPPGKKGSYGDSIIWETLLKKTKKKEDLYFITGDKDYLSLFSDEKFNEFLSLEWEKEKESELFFFKNLNKFTDKHLKQIKIKEEENKNKLIEGIKTSGSYAVTHTIIAELNKFSNFSDQQIITLVENGAINSQVYWIAEDTDVYSFYKNLISGKKDLFNKKYHLIDFLDNFKENNTVSDF